MVELFRQRTDELRDRMCNDGIDVALIAHPDNVYYFTAYWGDLGTEFGRPTIVVVPRDGDPGIITAAMEAEMAAAMTWVDDVRPYSDGVGREWRDPLGEAVDRFHGRIGIERYHCPPMVAEFLRERLGGDRLRDLGHMVANMRMVKSAEELAEVRQAGQVAVAMGEGGKDAIAEGVPEFEVCLACMDAGTRKAAQLMAADDPNSLMSPVIHNLQVLNFGHFTSMTHMHPTVRKLEFGDPVYMCFCSIAHFKQIKLGYDREYFVGEVNDERARLYETCIAAQRAAVGAIRPGISAEEVHMEAVEIYRSHGFDSAYRTGRALGYSSLEKPELKCGDKTVLKAGMVFAVDGGITVPGRFGARVGDTYIVTDSGRECVTESPRSLTVL